MQNPLAYFKEVIERDKLALVRHEFTSNPSYNPNDDSIFTVVTDSFSDAVVEVRLTFNDHLKQLLSQQRDLTIQLLNDNLHSIPLYTDKADYIASIEDELRYLTEVLLQSPQVSSEAITSELEVIQNHIEVRYNSRKSIANHERLKWQGDPAIFFILFQELYASSLICNTPSKRSLQKVAFVLYEMFDIKPSGKDKEQYTLNAFYQNLKSTSLLQVENSNTEVKALVQEFVAALKRKQ